MVMRAFALPATLLLTLVGIGATAAAHKTESGNGHWEMVRPLDEAFAHTANLRSGKGICRCGHSRQPSLPSAFSVERHEKAGEDGSGSVKATGLAPHDGHYAMTGTWTEGNVGTWDQNWKTNCGHGESDRYQTHEDGTARLTVSTDAHLAMSLDFATDRSGRGTVANAKGLTGKIAWDNQGDGTIAWADDASQTFENWKI